MSRDKWVTVERQVDPRVTVDSPTSLTETIFAIVLLMVGACIWFYGLMRFFEAW